MPSQGQVLHQLQPFLLKDTAGTSNRRRRSHTDDRRLNWLWSFFFFFLVGLLTCWNSQSLLRRGRPTLIPSFWPYHDTVSFLFEKYFIFIAFLASLFGVILDTCLFQCFRQSLINFEISCVPVLISKFFLGSYAEFSFHKFQLQGHDHGQELKFFILDHGPFRHYVERKKLTDDDKPEDPRNCSAFAWWLYSISDSSSNRSTLEGSTFCFLKSRMTSLQKMLKLRD